MRSIIVLLLRMTASEIPFRKWTTFVFGLLLSSSLYLNAAPGDLLLEVMTQTGNSDAGPGGVGFEQILTIGSGFEFPISLDESGRAVFAATTLVEGVEQRGVFRVGPGSPDLLFQVGQPIPGLLQNGEPVVSKGLGEFSTSVDGSFQAIRIGDGESYLYRVNGGVVESTPITWEDNISQTRNFKGSVTVSDGRGDTRSFGMNGSVDTMTVSNTGVVFWETFFGGTSTFFRARSKDTIVAIAFEGTDAPGFDAAIDAKLDAPWALRGTDQFGDSYFVTRIMNTGSTFRAVYRHDASDNSLDLLYPVAGNILEGLTASSTVNLQEEDVAVLKDGTVFIRGSIDSSNTGFWKREMGGEFVQVILLNEFMGTQVDGENLGFRSVAVDFADWAVAEDHTVFFTADIRNGTSGINQEGVWRVDPVTKAVTNVARALFDAPGTDATYGAILDIAAAGEGFVVFTCELSNGKKGLFASDTNGEVGKLAVEGDRVAIEGGRLVSKESDSLEGNMVNSFYFTPDIAGENLSKSQGNWGMNDFGEVAFHVELDNGVEALVRASFEGVKVPRGNTYIWDGGAGDSNWHTVKDGRSNWVDAAGTPWDKAPPFDGSATISIGVDYVVEILDEEVYVSSISNIGSILKVRKTLSFESVIDLKADASIEFSATIDGTSINALGLLIKDSGSEVDFRVNSLKITDADLIVEGGILDLKCDQVTFTRGGIRIEGGKLQLEADVQFLGEGCEVKGLAGSGGMVMNTTSFSAQKRTIFEFESGVTCVFGRAGSGATLDMDFGGTYWYDAGKLELKGKGKYLFYEPVHISEFGQLSNNTYSYDNSESGLFFEIPAEAVIVAEGTLQNGGNMRISAGGIRGDFKNVGSFTSTGPLTILDCENFRQMYFEADVRYGILKGGTWSANFHLRNSANLLPEDPNISELIIGEREGIIIESGQSKIEFHSFDSPNMEGYLRVEKSASAVVEKVNTGLSRAIFSISEDSQLKITDLVFRDVEFVGNGTCILEGEINALDDAFGFFVESKFTEIRNADLFGPGGDQFVVFHFRPDRFANPAVPVNPRKILLEDVTTHNGAILASYNGAEVTVQGTLTLGDDVLVQDTWKLKGDVRVSETFDINAKCFSLGEVPPVPPRPDALFANYYRSLPKPIAKDGHMLVCPDLTRGLVFDPPLNFATDKSSVTIGKNSELTITSPNIAVALENGKLDAGTWVIEDFAAVDVFSFSPNLNLKTIGKNAVVKLGKPHATKSSFNNLPNVKSDLLVEGALYLNGVDLEMNGNIVRNKGHVYGPGKIKGDVESIRDQVQGIIQLAGNITIEGNLTSDGVIALGASAGVGLVTGDLTLLPGSDMRVEFSGTEPGTGFDFLEIGGTANLDGKLTLSLIDEYIPDKGAGFLFLKAGTVSGDFSDIDQGTLGRQRRFDVTAGLEGLTATMQALSIASYSDWRAAFFSETEVADDLISGLGADPDDDGIVNLAEYLSNGLPKGPSLEPLKLVTESPDTFLLQLANGVADYTWQLETSRALEGWSAVDVNVTELSVEEDVSFFGLDLLTPAAEGDRFYRLGIETVP